MTTTNKTEQNWIEMVAFFAAKRVAAGESIEAAIKGGIADHGAQLERLYAAVAGGSPRWQGAVDALAGQVYDELRK